MSKSKDKTGGAPSDGAAQDAQSVVEAPDMKQAQAIDVLAVDEHAGKPGSYVFDPETSKRTKAA